MCETYNSEIKLLLNQQAIIKSLNSEDRFDSLNRLNRVSGLHVWPVPQKRVADLRCSDNKIVSAICSLSDKRVYNFLLTFKTALLHADFVS